MKRTVKIAALGAALTLSLAALTACGSDAEITEKYDIIVESSGIALGIQSGEILINETVTAETDVEGHAVNGTTDTHIIFDGNTADSAPSFTLTTIVEHPETGEPAEYELVVGKDTVIELIDGSGQFVEGMDIPDIFEPFRIDYSASDIKEATVEPKEKGVKLYTLTMKPEYADKFDTESDGVVFDCTAVVYNYYIDPEKNIDKLLIQYTSTLTVDGVSQTVVKAIAAQIA